MNPLLRISAAAALATAVVIASASSAAHAQAVEPPPEIVVPRAELRLLGGFGGLAGEAAVSALDHRLRAEAGLHGWSGLILAEAAVLVRALGSPASALWVRGGFMAQSIDYSCNMTDSARAWDAGVAYRKRWAGGSLLVAETGVETVSRDRAFACNDSGLSTGSVGLRVSVGGQIAITRGFGIYARAGLRTAEHLNEIDFLPEGLAGIAFDL